METQTLQAEVREGRGKGPARQLRMSGKIPAVLYGPGIDTVAIAVSPKALLKALDNDHGRNTLLSLTLPGGAELAMVKDIQVHPVERKPVHVDFYRVTADVRVSVRVPLVATGRAIGVQKGGKQRVLFRHLPVRVMPAGIPAAIELDVSGLDIGAHLDVSDLQLPEGVEVAYPPDKRLVVVGEDKHTEEEAPEETSEAAAAGEAPAAKGS